MRLRDGTHESNGRVETCQNGIWGSVCSDNMWDVHDAGVVCRQLNFTSDGSYNIKINNSQVITFCFFNFTKMFE